VTPEQTAYEQLWARNNKFQAPLQTLQYELERAAGNDGDDFDALTRKVSAEIAEFIRGQCRYLDGCVAAQRPDAKEQP